MVDDICEIIECFEVVYLKEFFCLVKLFEFGYFVINVLVCGVVKVMKLVLLNFFLYGFELIVDVFKEICLIYCNGKWYDVCIFDMDEFLFGNVIMGLVVIEVFFIIFMVLFGVEVWFD